MRKGVLLVINGSVILFVMALLFSRFSSIPGVAQEGAGLPGPAEGGRSATHLAFVTYGETAMAPVTAPTVARALDENGRVRTAQPSQSLFSQAESSLCQTDAAQSPAANCGFEATPVPSTPVPAAVAVQLTNFEDSLVYDIAWSPDGRQLAFTANDAVWTLEPGQAPVQVSQSGIARHPVWLVGP